MKNFLATVILFAVVMCTSLARAASIDIALTKVCYLKDSVLE